MTHEYDTNGRVALDPLALGDALAVHYRPVTTSTQVDAKALVDAGEAVPFAVVTDEQTAGRGRLDRTWQAPANSGVMMSVVLAAPHEPAFTLRVGVAVVRALAAAGVDAALKWPNDVVVPLHGRTRKLGGIIAELHGTTVIVGIGLNLDLRDDELPTADAISCRQLGVVPDRAALIRGLLRELTDELRAIPLEEYRRRCITLGSHVEVSRLVGSPLVGLAVAVDDDGALVVEGDEGTQRVTTGDVRHARLGERS